MTSKPLTFMNESILLEALKEIVVIADEFYKNYPNKASKKENDIYKLATEAIKKWEDSSGKETGMKWVSVNERLPEKRHNYFVQFRIPENSVISSYLWNGTCLFDGQKFIDDINKVELSSGNTVEFWLDESVPPYKEEGLEIKRLKLAEGLLNWAIGRGYLPMDNEIADNYHKWIELRESVPPYKEEETK